MSITQNIEAVQRTETPESQLVLESMLSFAEECSIEDFGRTENPNEWWCDFMLSMSSEDYMVLRCYFVACFEMVDELEGPHVVGQRKSLTEVLVNRVEYQDLGSGRVEQLWRWPVDVKTLAPEQNKACGVVWQAIQRDPLAVELIER